MHDATNPIGPRLVDEDHRIWHQKNPNATLREHIAFHRSLGLSSFEDRRWHARHEHERKRALVGAT